MEEMLSGTELAEIFGVRQSELVRLVKLGLPQNKEGKHPVYDLAECTSWYINFLKKNNAKAANNLKEALTRKANLQSDKLEIDLQVIRGELVETSTIVKQWEQILQELKMRLLLIPKKSAAIFDSLTNPDELEEIIEDFINEALKELSRLEI